MNYNELEFSTIFNHCSFKSLIKFSDGTLRTEDGCTFKIHKIHLAKHSKYFYELFCLEASDDQNEFLIPGVSGKIMGNVLSYLYMDSVHITETNVCDTLMAANYLKLEDLIQHIKKVYLKNIVSIRNCLPLYIAEQNIDPNDTLSSAIYRCVQTNFEAIVQTVDGEIGKLSLKSFKKLLADRNLRVSNESVIWMAIDKWVLSDLNHRRGLVPDLLTYLSVSEIDENIATMIVEHDLVKLNPDCEEIKVMQHSSKSDSNLEILRRYIQQQPKAELSTFDRRIPEYVHFIPTRTGLYVTYDENVDLWRKIGTKRCRYFDALIGENIYYFGRGFKITCYNLIKEDFIEMPQFVEHATLTYGYQVVELKGLIYVLGGHTGQTAVGVSEVYDPDEHLWHTISPMIPIHYFKAVVLEGRIYVVALDNVYKSTISNCIQVYYSEQDAWITLRGPSITRKWAGIVPYRGKLFVIGGRKDFVNLTSVEVFDPVREEWTNHKDLPDIFELCDFHKAIVLKDKLFVYGEFDNEKLEGVYPSFYWDENLENWIELEESSPFKLLHKYPLHIQYNWGMLNTIVKTNRELATKFEKSPFN